jgi:PAS domain S-box-containing protein
MVDDSPANLLALESILEPMGHVLVSASSGEDALRWLMRDDFAVVLMDVRMPGVDGLQAAALMKQRQRAQRTPIILISAISGEREDIVHGYQQGAVDYLVKPIDADILCTKVSVFVDLYLKAYDIKRQAAALLEQERVGEALRARMLVEQNARKIAEESGRNFRTLAETMPQMCWATTSDGSVDYYNQRWLEYTGQTLEEALSPGRRRDVHHADTKLAVVERWAASLASGTPFEMEAPLRRVDGVYRLHLLRASPLRDAQGAITRWFGTCTDIHDRRALIAESIRMEAREQEMLQVALRADVSAALSKNDDLSTMLQGCCEALVRHLGVSFARVWTIEPASDVLVLRASAGKYTHIDGGHAQVPVGSLEIGLIAKERRPHVTNDVSTDERVGDREWARREGMVSFAGYPLVVGDRVVGVVAMFAQRALDSRHLNGIEVLTDTLAQGIVRKRAEEALDQRAAELTRSNAELERFAYIASHDLQEPLRMVASYTQLLGRRYKGKLSTEADEFIAFAIDGANRMQALINDLLAFSRVGTKAAPMVPTSLERPVDVALANLRMAIEESGAIITRDALPTVVIDERQLVQLFQNLIANALKFRGGKPPRVHIGAEQAGDEWRILVRDNGVGIDPQFFGRLFVLFQRLHAASEYEGTGIGLAICKKIIDRHGGRIWVESAPGEGATFIFTLRGSPA